MRVSCLVTAFLFLFSSCGSLRLSPIGCQGDGLWSEKPLTGELSITETYYVLNFDREIRLKEFLEKRNINCRAIKKMYVKIDNVFFVKRELTVFVQK